MSIRISKWYPLNSDTLWTSYRKPFMKDLNRLANATNEQEEEIARYMLRKDTENTSFYHAFVTERDLIVWKGHAANGKENLRDFSAFFCIFAVITVLFGLILSSHAAFISACVIAGISFILLSASYLCNCETEEYKLYKKSLRMAQNGNTS